MSRNRLVLSGSEASPRPTLSAQVRRRSLASNADGAAPPVPGTPTPISRCVLAHLRALIELLDQFAGDRLLQTKEIEALIDLLS